MIFNQNLNLFAIVRDVHSLVSEVNNFLNTLVCIISIFILIFQKIIILGYLTKKTKAHIVKFFLSI